MINLIKNLCSLAAPSGDEQNIYNFINEKAIKFADEIKTDAMGNLMVFRCGKRKTTKPFMFCTHMDEVGFIIKRITEDGMLKFGFIGEIDPKSVIGKRVIFGDVIGVVGIKAVHLTTKEERKQTPKIKDLYIDIGSCSKNEAQNKVCIGDYGVFYNKPEEFGDELLKAKALDSRTGCAILLKLLETKPPIDTWFVFTTQKHVGFRGATTASYFINPQICINLCGTDAADIPNVKQQNQACSLRKGVVFPFMDKSIIYDKNLFNLLKDIAQKNNIPFQIKTSTTGLSNSSVIQKSLDGIKTACVCIPIRYNHSSACVCSIEDIQNTKKFLTALLNSFCEQNEFI